MIRLPENPALEKLLRDKTLATLAASRNTPPRVGKLRPWERVAFWLLHRQFAEGKSSGLGVAMRTARRVRGWFPRKQAALKPEWAT
ncbi:hypothetical protein K2X33_08100 [bacterium]|nr:hypothetical protein [bacterium]